MPPETSLKPLGQWENAFAHYLPSLFLMLIAGAGDGVSRRVGTGLESPSDNSQHARMNLERVLAEGLLCSHCPSSVHSFHA